MKFKMPEHIGDRLWYYSDSYKPCCAVGHIAHQLGYDFQEYERSIDTPTPMRYAREKLGLESGDIACLQSSTDRAFTQEERKEIFREFLTSHGHEVIADAIEETSL